MYLDVQLKNNRQKYKKIYTNTKVIDSDIDEEIDELIFYDTNTFCYFFYSLFDCCYKK
jgi:hypothetical protein